MRFLFVCIGNICRSPMAAGLAQKMLKGEGQAESAGIAPFGGSVTEEVLSVMREEGIDLSEHRPRHIAEMALDDFDCVVSLDPYVYRYLKERCRIAPIKLLAWDIDDPYGQDIDAYTRCAQVISSHMTDLLTQLGILGDDDG